MTPLIIALVLFAIGIYGVLSRRDLLRLLISVSVILGSITLLLVAQASSSSYSFVLFVWAVEVVEIIIALAAFIYLARSGKTDLHALTELKW